MSSRQNKEEGKIKNNVSWEKEKIPGNKSNALKTYATSKK